jgi:hypothetical protein
MGDYSPIADRSTIQDRKSYSELWEGGSNSMKTPTAHIGHCHVGDFATFYTYGEARSVSGRVVGLQFGETQGDYHTVTLDSDGMPYHFGTGGHLGDTWTTESGSEQWFKA